VQSGAANGARKVMGDHTPVNYTLQCPIEWDKNRDKTGKSKGLGKLIN